MTLLFALVAHQATEILHFMFLQTVQAVILEITLKQSKLSFSKKA